MYDLFNTELRLVLKIILTANPDCLPYSYSMNLQKNTFDSKIVSNQVLYFVLSVLKLPMESNEYFKIKPIFTLACEELYSFYGKTSKWDGFIKKIVSKYEINLSRVEPNNNFNHPAYDFIIFDLVYKEISKEGHNYDIFLYFWNVIYQDSSIMSNRHISKLYLSNVFSIIQVDGMGFEDAFNSFSDLKTSFRCGREVSLVDKDKIQKIETRILKCKDKLKKFIPTNKFHQGRQETEKDIIRSEKELETLLDDATKFNINYYVRIGTLKELKKVFDFLKNISFSISDEEHESYVILFMREIFLIVVIQCQLFLYDIWNASKLTSVEMLFNEHKEVYQIIGSLESHSKRIHIKYFFYRDKYPQIYVEMIQAISQLAKHFENEEFSEISKHFNGPNGEVFKKNHSFFQLSRFIRDKFINDVDDVLQLQPNITEIQINTILEGNYSFISKLNFNNFTKKMYNDVIKKGNTSEKIQLLIVIKDYTKYIYE